MKNITMLTVLSLVTFVGFAQDDMADLCQKMSDKKVIRVKLPVEFTPLKERGKYLLEVGKHKGTYQIVTNKAYGTHDVITLDGRTISLGSIRDEITGQPMASRILALMLDAFYIDLNNQRYLCLIATTSGAGSFAAYQSVYLLDWTRKKNKVHYLVLRYGYELSFGDFNKDGILDVFKHRGYDCKPKPEEAKNLVDCVEFNVYTLVNDKFEPLKSEKYKVQVIVKRDFSVKVVKYRWF